MLAGLLLLLAVGAAVDNSTQEAAGVHREGGGLLEVAEAEGGRREVAEGGRREVVEGRPQELGKGGLQGVAEGGLREVAEGGPQDVAKGGVQGVAEGGPQDVAKGGLQGVAEGGSQEVAKGGLQELAEGGPREVADVGPPQEAPDEGRGMGKMKKTLKKWMPYLMVPTMMALGYAPFVLASLKMMVMNAVTLNMMALNAAIFLTLRNWAFGPRLGQHVRYYNFGYGKKKKHHHHHHHHRH